MKRFLAKLTPIHWIGIGVLILLLIGISYYNSFVSQTNQTEAQWQQVEVQYQRRVDLIPNLVESVKGIMKQEQKIFGDVTSARAKYTGATSTESKVRAAGELEGTLSRLFAIFENYPQLKSDQTVLKLQDEIAGTENRVAVERRRYNELVQNYNISVTTLPGKLFASIFGFGPKTYFEAAPGSENAPKVEF